MSVTYVTGVPAANNNPSNDQPNMLVNTNSINTWTGVDHIGFNVTNGGQHAQCTFPGITTPPTPTGLGGVLYTVAGTADSTTSVVKYQNANIVFPVSLVRAYGVFTVSGGVLSAGQSINVASMVRTSIGLYTITLNANVVTSTTYGVITSFSSSSATQPLYYSITSSTVFTLKLGVASVDVTGATFIVTQL